MQTAKISAAIFIALVDSAPVGSAVPPSATCKTPAPIEGKWDAAAPGYVVVVQNDRDLDTVMARLIRTYHLKPFPLKMVHGFILRGLDDGVLQQLRCDRDVKYISHDQSTSTG